MHRLILSDYMISLIDVLELCFSPEWILMVYSLVTVSLSSSLGLWLCLRLSSHNSLSDCIMVGFLISFLSYACLNMRMDLGKVFIHSISANFILLGLIEDYLFIIWLKRNVNYLFSCKV